MSDMEIPADELAEAPRTLGASVTSPDGIKFWPGTYRQTPREIPADELAEAEMVATDVRAVVAADPTGIHPFRSDDLAVLMAEYDERGRERDAARAEVERLRTDVLAALHAEGDPVRAASFVREVADKLATELSQADEFGRGEFRVTQDAYDQAVKQLERLRARDEKATAVVQAVRRYGLLSDAARAALDALARAHEDGA